MDDFDVRGPPMYTGRVSAVYHAVDRRSGVTIALKIYKRSKLTDIERVQVSREINLHCSLVHESVIAMYAAWKDDHLVYMALEWAAGVSERIGRIDMSPYLTPYLSLSR